MSIICKECGAEPLECTCAMSAVRLSSQEELLEVFHYALSNAQEEIWICAPWISMVIVKQHLQEFRSAQDRNVKIYVYCDNNFNIDYKKSHLEFDPPYKKPYRVRFRSGVELLQQMGVAVFAMQGVHNKTLCVDNKLIVEGSLNWLSASRNKKSLFYRHDSGIAAFGSGAEEFIRNFKISQFKVPLEHSTIIFDLERAIANEGSREFAQKYIPEPSVTLTIPIKTPTDFYFCVGSRIAGRVERRGVTSRMIERGGERLFMARSVKLAVQRQLVLRDFYDLPEDEEDDESFFVFKVQLPIAGRIEAVLGDFSRDNMYEDPDAELYVTCELPVDSISKIDIEYV